MECEICSGKRYIVRESKTIENIVEEEVWDSYSECYRMEDRAVISYVGGLDACPNCTKASEAEYG